MAESAERVQALLMRLGSWAQVRVVMAVAEMEGGADAYAVSRQTRLPEQEVEALLATLERLGVLWRVERQGQDEPRYALSETVELEGLPDPAPPVAAAPQQVRLDPSPAAEGRDARQVAADVGRLYWRLFERQPNLSWLLRQRRRAMLLGEDFAALLTRVQAARPQGNPQAYLEGMLKRLERDHGRSG